MPLSSEEWKRLEELEREFDAEDPGLAQRLSYRPGRPPFMVHSLFATFIVCAGVVVLFVGIVSQLTVVGIAGFLLMFFGAFRIATLLSPP